MTQVKYIQDGNSETIVGANGDSVMMTAVQNGIEGIVAECGGSLSCATCHVYVDEDWFGRTGPVSEDELEMLEGAMSPAGPTSRLSCQIELTDDLDGLTVRIPEEQ
ncbi:2Fe-2S iron-sulfur cluster-binding protein [Dietzia psychralcaliphila]|uniref:2Fe-2S iron-sulfur cluster-binding protein n=1 Tax=Dietzia psychralcaliphila TaxID=139021 RepID=UPI001C1E44C1|nr:2Fe-2S iron-sulfur cluster-binding protein [Dietzia psychralcaliphila]